MVNNVFTVNKWYKSKNYINKKFIYTLNTECLEDEIKTIAGSLIEISNELENIILEEDK